MHCARVLAKFSLYPVHILNGGFWRFATLYPFLRTKKILYTITVKHDKHTLLFVYIINLKTRFLHFSFEEG